MSPTGNNLESQGGGCIPPHAPNLAPVQIRLITGEELAHELLFAGTTSAFRQFCKNAGIEPVPGRKDCYDPVAVRHKLNEIQGLGASPDARPESALARSIMRRNG